MRACDRRTVEYFGRRALDINVPGRRQRGRSRKRGKDITTSDMEVVGSREEDEMNRSGGD